MIEMVLQRIREYSNAVKKRDVKIDALRGLAVLCVMMTHAGITGNINSIVSTIMLPLFLFVTGYLWKQDSIYQLLRRISWLFVSWIVISYVQAIVNVETIIEIINNPVVLWEIVGERTVLVLQGEAVWYLPALMVVSIIVWGLLALCDRLKNRNLVLLISSLLALLAGFFLISQGKNFYWYIDWAIVNQFFVVLGIVIRKYENHFSFVMRMLCITLYIMSILVLLREFDFAGFNVRRNQYGNIVVYFVISSLAVLLCFSIIRFVKCRWFFLSYLGRHSILLFAFGPHGYFFGKKILDIIDANISPNAKAIFISLSACILWIIPAIVIDLWIPILNGQRRIVRKNYE